MKTERKFRPIRIDLSGLDQESQLAVLKALAEEEKKQKVPCQAEAAKKARDTG